MPGVSWGKAAGLVLPTPGEDQGCPPPGGGGGGGMGKNAAHPGVEATVNASPLGRSAGRSILLCLGSCCVRWPLSPTRRESLQHP